MAVITGSEAQIVAINAGFRERNSLAVRAVTGAKSGALSKLKDENAREVMANAQVSVDS